MDDKAFEEVLGQLNSKKEALETLNLQGEGINNQQATSLPKEQPTWRTMYRYVTC